MPSSITHQLIAEEAAKQFPPNLKEAVSRNGDYFFLGAQGPDAFFFLSPFSSGENLGKLLHRSRVYETFSAMLEFLRGQTDGTDYERALAYVAGYISHYCADTAFHPFVYAYLDALPEKGMIHQRIENDWDVYFLREYRKREVERYAFPFSPKKINREKTLFRLYAFLCEKLKRKSLSERKFKAAIKRFHLYLRAFHGKCYRRQKSYERAEKFFRAKPFLSCLYPRKDPERGVLEHENFSYLAGGKGKNADELFAYAVTESVQAADCFSKALVSGELPRDRFNKHFLNGKPTV